jgi:ribose transport system substrate-binding protein
VLSEAAAKHCTILQSYANGSASKQLSDVQTWIGEGVNAIVLLPLDASAIGSIMAQAHAHGVKVIGYAAQLASEDGSATFANTAAASAVGDYIAKWLRAQHAASADVAVLGGPPTCIICSERINGALAALKTAFPGVHVVATIIGQTAADGYSAMNTVLAGHPDVKVFISEADDGVIGGNRALIAAGKKPASVLFASFDGSEENLQQIASGQLNAVDASLNLQVVGKSIVDAAYNVLHHTQPLNLVTPYVIITSQTKAAARQLIKVNE